MKGLTAFSTFGLTAAALATVVGLAALRAGSAQLADASGAVPEMSDAHFPVVGLTRGESAQIHVVNLSTDTTSPAVRFLIMFFDSRGVLLKPEEPCDARAGETCTANLGPLACGPGQGRNERNESARCEFRAMVLVERQPCTTTVGTDGGVGVDGGAGGGVGGAGTWSSNLEILDRQGRTSLLAGPSQVTSIPIAQCNPPGTDNGVGTDGPFRTF